MATKLTARRKGPCGGKGQPPCPEEFTRMVNSDSRITDSYKRDLTKNPDSVLKAARSSGDAGRMITSGHLNRAVSNETAKRLKNIQSTPAYKAMEKNPNLKNTGVSRTVKNYESKINRGINSYDYQIPKASELKNIRSFGLESTKAKSIAGAVASSPIKSAKAYFEMNKVLKDYPNLDKIKKKEQKRIK